MFLQMTSELQGFKVYFLRPTFHWTFSQPLCFNGLHINAILNSHTLAYTQHLLPYWSAYIQHGSHC